MDTVKLPCYVRNPDGSEEVNLERQPRTLHRGLGGFVCNDFNCPIRTRVLGAIADPFIPLKVHTNKFDGKPEGVTWCQGGGRVERQ